MEEEESKVNTTSGFNRMTYFIKSYKNLNKKSQQYLYNKKESNHALAMLQKSEELTLLPCYLGIIGNENHALDLHKHRYGDKYV